MGSREHGTNHLQNHSFKLKLNRFKMLLARYLKFLFQHKLILNYPFNEYLNYTQTTKDLKILKILFKIIRI